MAVKKFSNHNFQFFLKSTVVFFPIWSKLIVYYVVCFINKATYLFKYDWLTKSQNLFYVCKKVSSCPFPDGICIYFYCSIVTVSNFSLYMELEMPMFTSKIFCGFFSVLARVSNKLLQSKCVVRIMQVCQRHMHVYAYVHVCINSFRNPNMQ